MEQSQYIHTFERKVQEVFEMLDIDPKRALKLIQKEIDSRGKKLEPVIMLNLKLVLALVLERNNRADDARDEVLGVLKEIKENDISDHYLLSAFSRYVARMQDRSLFTAKYLEVVEYLLSKKPQDKDLVFTMYEGSLQNNNFNMAAKMAGKMYQSFDNPQFALPQIQCLYMDS